MIWVRRLIVAAAVVVVASCSASTTIEQAEVAEAATPTPVPPPARDVATWCADVAPVMYDALKNVIITNFQDPDAFPDAVEELHLLYRQSTATAPVEILPEVEQVNASLDELEPIMRPIGWDYDQIDRSFVAEPDRVYTDAGIAIDVYNSETCNMELGAMLPTEAELNEAAEG